MCNDLLQISNITLIRQPIRMNIKKITYLVTKNKSFFQIGVIFHSMWLWIILAVISLGNTSIATPEIITNEFSPEDVTGDDSLFLYVDERSFESPHRRDKDIEARRRSALDKNFMRFGRSDPYLSFVYDSDEGGNEFPRDSRSHNKNDNFIRFGRGRANDFLRFGRDPYKYTLNRISRASQDKNFIRFGRSVPQKRSRRDVYSQDFNQQYKRAKNNRDMLRFGRRDNYLRFGRMPYENDKQQTVTNDKEKTAINHIFPYDSSLLQLLTELAQKLHDKDAFSRIG